MRVIWTKLEVFEEEVKMLTVYTLNDFEQWDNAVRSFKEYDVYWLNGYVKSFYIHGDGEPLLFVYDDGTTRGINVVMKRDIAKDERFKGRIPEGQYFDISTPYGYGGWIIEGEDTGKLFAAYEDWIKRNGIISEFVRFHPFIRNSEKCTDFYEVIRLNTVVHMNLDSPKVIWDNIISKNRNMIRKAIKNDVKVYNGRFPEIYEKFRVIYNGTMDKDNADKYYYFAPEFYTSLLEDLPDNAQVFWAEKDGEVIAASIMLAANGRMNYHLSGFTREYGTLAPTNLILYRAALWGSANGYKTFNLGGGLASGVDNLFRFKKAFYRGDDLNYFYVGRKIYDPEGYDRLTQIREDSIENRNFFPIYRG